MHRNPLIQKLEAYLPAAVEEGAAKEKILSFIKIQPRCFERDLEMGHVTASAWLLSRDFSKALLMLHAKLGIWVQLGGHCDGEADVLSVALREAKEESGIQRIVAVSEEIFDLAVYKIPANKKEKEHEHYDIRFLLMVTSDEKIVQNSESLHLQWFGKEESELPTKHPSILRMHCKWIQANHLKGC